MGASIVSKGPSINCYKWKPPVSNMHRLQCHCKPLMAAPTSSLTGHSIIYRCAEGRLSHTCYTLVYIYIWAQPSHGALLLLGASTEYNIVDQAGDDALYNLVSEISLQFPTCPCCETGAWPWGQVPEAARIGTNEQAE